ncbi:MAG: hypothetical protein ACJ79W_26455 [Myxococcales bacterium]
MRVAILVACVCSAGAVHAQEQSLAQRWDELWAHRETADAQNALARMAKGELAKDPNSFDGNWRRAALLVWQADGAADGSELKAQLGKLAWEAGDKAVAAKPDDVRGHYFAGTGLGLYSEGVGILTALSQGLEGKFRDRIQGALKIDKDFLNGGPQVVWGRYFYKLPWPKRDVRESVRVLSAAVEQHPKNLRAKLYLADSLADDGKGAEAKKVVQQILDAPLQGDPPEEKRMKDLAKKWLSKH